MKINTDGSMELTVDEYIRLANEHGGITVTDSWSNRAVDTTFDNGPRPAFAEEAMVYGKAGTGKTVMVDVGEKEMEVRTEEAEAAADVVANIIGHGTIACSIWRSLWDSRKQYPEGWTLQELVDCTDFNRASISGALQRLRRMGYVRNVSRRWRAKL